MESVILLNSNENTRQVEEEEKTRFVQQVLNAIGLPLDDIWNEQNKMNADGRAKMRNLLSTYKLQIIDDAEGGLQIYATIEQPDKNQQHSLIAEWFKPRYVLKKDLHQIDPRKKLYLEMHCKYHSAFDED